MRPASVQLAEAAAVLAGACVVTAAILYEFAERRGWTPVVIDGGGRDAEADAG